MFTSPSILFRHFSLIVALSVALLLSTPQGLMAQPGGAVAIGGGAQRSGSYQLGPGDVLKIVVLKQDLLTQDDARIGNDGKVRLLMLDEPVQAACLTEDAFAAVLTEKYRKFLLNPQVYVSVKQFNATTIAVIGAVNSPGRFQLQRPVRLLELLTFVNGPSPAASKELQVLRTSGLLCGNENTITAAPWSPDAEPEIISLNIKDVLDGASEANLFLRGGDIVRVVEAEQRQAYVIGSVRSATTVNLKESVTLSTAIAMSGGAVSGAQLEKIKITRQTPGSLSKQDFFVNLKDIREGKQADIMLEPNDIVDVPGPSATKKFLKDIFRSIVPVFTRVPVIIP
jgi:protein involved in polysaccharide export with SLBB domain